MLYITRVRLTNMLKIFKVLVIFAVNFIIVSNTTNTVHAAESVGRSTSKLHCMRGIWGKCYHKTALDKIRHDAKYGNWWDYLNRGDESEDSFDTYVTPDYSYCCHRDGDDSFDDSCPAVISNPHLTHADTQRESRVTTNLETKFQHSRRIAKPVSIQPVNPPMDTGDIILRFS